MVVKSRKESQHTEDLREVFEILRRHKLRLNTEKCTFGVGAGKFLGYLISTRGIEANPDQIEAVNCLRPPSNPKKVICNAEIHPWNVFVDGASNAMGAGAGSFEARDSWMKAYLSVAKQMIGQFGTIKVAQVGRSQNKHADSLAALASSATEDTPRLVKIEVIREPSISVKSIHDQARVEVTKVIVANSCWMNPIIDFLAKDKVPNDEDEAKKIRRVAPRYWLSSNYKLYQRSFAGPYLLCLHPEKMQKDAAEYVRRCEQCQKYTPLIHQPAGRPNPVSNPWPFAQWGLDILGPFPRATGNRHFILVAVDYFTKWAKAEALANIRDIDMKKFVWKNIVTRFGVPNSLITDNGLQFDSKAFRAFCSELGIKNKYSTTAYLQSNGQVEAVNKTILNGLKRRLDGVKGRWAEELPNVLWAYHTTPR
ncbi:uncharacterized protein LOC115990394 [Quercus lobata]|uniref:uncharacterized protein LOC115990394 n=1 Tax=Quercus lobata TaxID=97700 RepID=UPI001246AC6A|nr:uncharacterized protein LOC115990394 [Quercus lobata]